MGRQHALYNPARRTDELLIEPPDAEVLALQYRRTVRRQIVLVADMQKGHAIGVARLQIRHLGATVGRGALRMPWPRSRRSVP